MGEVISLCSKRGYKLVMAPAGTVVGFTAGMAQVFAEKCRIFCYVENSVIHQLAPYLPH